jgi:hypothetical protein
MSNATFDFSGHAAGRLASVSFQIRARQTGKLGMKQRRAQEAQRKLALSAFLL